MNLVLKEKTFYLNNIFVIPQKSLPLKRKKEIPTPME